MVNKIEEILVINIPKEKFDQLFIKSPYDTMIQILQCYEENKELLHLLMNSSHNSSFQTKLRDKLKQVLTGEIFPHFKNLQYEIPVDLLILVFTSLSLSLAEYAYQSKTPINIEKLADFMISIFINGPAKTLELAKDGDDFVKLFEMKSPYT